MIIKHDTNYISADEFTLMDNGYAKKSVYSVHFGRYFSDEEKEANAAAHSTMTREEWGNRCDEIAKYFEKHMPEIVNEFANKYDIHQISHETSTIAHFRSNWDLYYNPHYVQGYDKKRYFDGFTLTFNENRSVEHNMQMLSDIISMSENMNYKNIACRVQYCAVIDKEKVAKDVIAACEKISGKFIEYCGMIGKIKPVKETPEGKQYGFFRKNARSRYYPVSYSEILAMSL